MDSTPGSPASSGRAAGSRTDDDLLSDEHGLPAGDGFDEDMPEAEQGPAGPPSHPLVRHLRVPDTAPAESFLAEFMPLLHALASADGPGGVAPMLDKCLRSCLAIYDYMIKNQQVETEDALFLMYSSFYQPLFRDVLPGVLPGLLHDEAHVQLCNGLSVWQYRHIIQQFIMLVAKYLHLHVRILQGRELVPTISQRVGEDLSQLLRTLASVVDSSNKLLWWPAFHSEPPSNARGWDPVEHGTWAVPDTLPQVPPPKPPAQPEAAGDAGEGAGGEGAGGEGGAAAEAAAEAGPAPAPAADSRPGSGLAESRGSGADFDIDLTADEPPQTPSRQVAASMWQAAFIDCFGQAGGWDALLEMLAQPGLVGEYLCYFLQPLAAAAHRMLPARRAALLPAAAAAAQLVRSGLEAAPDLSALEGGGGPHSERKVVQVLWFSRKIMAAATSPEAAEEAVGPLQREHLLRLLRASAFTRQLVGVKLLREFVYHTFYPYALPASTEALTAWLQQNGVVEQMLKSNLHQAQYAEHAQKVLSMLLQHGALSEDSIAFLWQLTQDANTFEGVKSNAYSILASLGPHMEPSQLGHLFQRLRERAAASGVAEAASICSLLVGMAQQDREARMWQQVLACLLGIVLREDAPPEVAGSQAVVDLCASYDHALANDACSLSAAHACIASLEGAAAVPAAVVLNSLMVNIWHKPDRLRVAMHALNPGAELLRSLLTHYTSWLDRQRAKAAALAAAGASASAAHAGAAPPPEEGPPAGAFSHKAAVDAWMQLLRLVITKGNFFLLQSQLEIMAEWATAHEVVPYDAQAAWDLVAKMVAGGRKEVCQDVADKFLTEWLCQLAPEHFTLPAWRCLLAYVTTVSWHKWDAEFTDEDVSPNSAWVSLANREAVCTFLYRSCLHCSDARLAQQAARLLARILAVQLCLMMGADNAEAHRQLLAGEAARCLRELRSLALAAAAAPAAAGPAAAAAQEEPAAASSPTAVAAAAAAQAGPQDWFAPPAALAAAGAAPAEAQQLAGAAQQCQRILQYLTVLVEECQERRLPARLPHRSSWEGFEMTVNVQLPAQQGQKPHKVQLVLPTNLPVGRLRGLVAELVGKQPQFVRLLGGGREFEMDWWTLAQSRAGQQLLMAQLSAKPNSYTSRDEAAAEAAGMAGTVLASQPDTYRLALALAQCPAPLPPPPGLAAASSAAARAAGGGSRLVGTALHLLQALPTCPIARRQLAQALLALDGGHQLRAMLLHGPAAAVAAGRQAAGGAAGADAAPSAAAAGQQQLQPAVLMYAVQTLCSVLFPQQDPGGQPPPASEEWAAAVEAAAGALFHSVAQRRLVLSGGLQVLLELATQLATAAGPAAAAAGGAAGAGGPAASGAASRPAADPSVAAATHAAMLLLLHRLRESLDKQQMELATAAATAAAAKEEACEAAAAGAGEAAGNASAPAAAAGAASGPSSMQVDGGSSAAADDGGSSGAGPAPMAGAAEEAGPGGSAHMGTAAAGAAAASRRAAEPSPAVSMAAAASADGEGAGAAASSQEGMVRASTSPGPMARAGEELEAAVAALGAQAPAIARYTLRMLCSTLGCDPAAGPDSPPTPPPPPPVSQPVEGATVSELCRQGLRLLKQLASSSSSAVQIITAEESAAAEAVVRRLLLHPTSANLCQQAAEWLPDFAAAGAPAHRWAFERILQPMLLAAGTGEGAGAGGGAAGGEGGSRQDQMALCNHFIDTLDYSEFPAARRLLDTLIQRLTETMQRLEPIDGIASVVLALIKRLDCREVGVTSGLVNQLIDQCCFPALNALKTWEAAMMLRLAAHGAAATASGAAPPAGAAGAAHQAQQAVLQQLLSSLQAVPAAAAGGGAAALPAPAAAPPPAAPQAPNPVAAAALASWQMATACASIERCIYAARLQGAGPGSSGSASREAAFDLLLDLAVHDSGCWRAAQERLQASVHAATQQLFGSPTGNVALHSLRPPGAFAGLQNGGATCYMSSVFQQLYMQPTIRRLILSAPGVPNEEQPDSVFHQMQSMFAHLTLGVEPWFEPRGFWRAFKDYDGQPVNIREHQDAYEFFTRLQDAVDEHLRALGCPRAIHAALGGTFAQLITVVEAPQYRSERDEDFYQISLDVRGKRTLAESLRSFVSKELMDGQNQYHSEELNKKVDAEKRTLIKELPHTLVLHLKRFEWDYETYQRWKVKDRFEFPAKLDMYPYTVEGADEADGREPASKKPPAHYRYELRGVVVHSGSAFAGHYYSYIKDRQPGGGWYCFDDTSVDAWDPARLDKDCFGGRFIPEGFTQECDRPNSAYMLFYERAEPEPAVGLPGAGAAAADTPKAAVEAPAAAVPVAAAPAVTPAGQGDVHMQQTPEPDTGAAPMSLSPGPASEQLAAAAAQPAPAPVAGGGEQPPAGAVQAAAPSQAAAAAGLAAMVAAGQATPHSMPRALYEAVLFSNMRQLCNMQILSPEYARLMWNLVIHLQEAVRAGTARKAAKREPTSSPGAMELSAASGSASGGGGGGSGGECQLMALTSRRGGDLHAVVADVAVLLLDYFLRVALRAGQELRREVLGTGGRRGMAGMDQPFIEALGKVPAAALAALTHLSSGPAAPITDMLLTQSTWVGVRSFVADVMMKSVDCVTRQERRTEEVVQVMRAFMDHLCTVTVPAVLPSLPEHGHVEQVLHVLHKVSYNKFPWRRALLDPHLTTLLTLIRSYVEVFYMDSERDPDSGHSALCLLSYTLRRFDPDPAPAERSRRKPPRVPGAAPEHSPHRNPHCLDACELAPMPEDVWQWLYADEAFPRKLLMPGALWGIPVQRLLGFLLYNDHVHADLWTAALIDHVAEDAQDWRELAPDLAVLAHVLTSTRDAHHTERLMTFLWGFGRSDYEGPVVTPQDGIIQEMMTTGMGKLPGMSHLLLGLALQLLDDAPEEVVRRSRLLDVNQLWIRWAFAYTQRLIQIMRIREQDESLHQNVPTTDELANECRDDRLLEMVDTDVMWKRLSRLARAWQQAAAEEEGGWAGGAAGSGSDATSSSSHTSSEGGPGQGPGAGGGRGGGGTGGGRGAQLAGSSVGARGGSTGGGGGGGSGGWQEGLMQYGDGEEGEVSTPPHGSGTAGGTAGGSGGTGRAAPPAAPAGPPGLTSPLGLQGRRQAGGPAGVVRAAEDAELPFQPQQQHISAGAGEPDEEAVIEIHSSDQDLDP